MDEQREEAATSRETKGGRTDIVALLRGTLSITKVSYNIMFILLLSLGHDCRCN